MIETAEAIYGNLPLSLLSLALLSSVLVLENIERDDSYLQGVM
jgi:hypothetical protein